jgi:hypothetical protein
MFGAHNAFVITLQENGLVGLGLLLALGLVMFVYSLLGALRPQDEAAYPWGVAGAAMTAGWLALIFMNWAQLNQAFSYAFLVLPLFYLNRMRVTVQKG